MNTEQKQSILNFKPTAGMLKCAETVIAAQAIHDHIEPIVAEYTEEVLAEMQAKSRWNSKELVLKFDDKWDLTDKDFEIFTSKIYPQHILHGFDVERNSCPVAIAQQAVIHVENALINLFEPLTTLTSKELVCSPDRRKAIDLMLWLVAPFLKK